MSGANVSDQYPEVLESAVRALLDGEESEVFTTALNILKPLAWRPGEPDPPPHKEHLALLRGCRLQVTTTVAAPSRGQDDEDYAAEIFAKEHYQCRWCGAKTIDGRLMRVIGRWFPSVIPYHKNGAAEATHPAIRYRWPAADHELAKARGGQEGDNLHCACWLCNSVKSDHALQDLSWGPREPADLHWKGLADCVEALENRLEAAARKYPKGIPRMAHPPSGVETRVLQTDDEEIAKVDQLLRQWAEDQGMSAVPHGAGHRYGDLLGTGVHNALVYLYPKQRKIEVGLDHVDPAAASEIRLLMDQALARRVRVSSFPGIPLQEVLNKWHMLRDKPLKRFVDIWRRGA